MDGNEDEDEDEFNDLENEFDYYSDERRHHHQVSEDLATRVARDHSSVSPEIPLLACGQEVDVTSTCLNFVIYGNLITIFFNKNANLI